MRVLLPARWMRLSVVCLMVCFSLLFPLHLAHAGVLQQVSASATGASAGSDEVFGLVSADITTDILARALGRGNEATAAAGRFGDVGVQAGSISPGSAQAEVRVISDEFVNLLGRPLHAYSLFIIDGGELRSLAWNETRAEFEMLVGARILGNVPLTDNRDDLLLAAGFHDVQFHSMGVLSTDGAGAATWTPSGEDIGATFSETFSNNYVVEIPFSAQRFDIGLVGSGERLLLDYQLRVLSNYSPVPGGAEIVTAKFSDPFSLSGNPVIQGSVFFEEVGSTIPEPSTYLLFGLGALGLVAWRRARRAA